MIRPSKEMGAIIRQSAAAENMSVQGYVLQTLYARTGATGGGARACGGVNSWLSSGQTWTWRNGLSPSRNK